MDLMRKLFGCCPPTLMLFGRWSRRHRRESSSSDADSFVPLRGRACKPGATTGSVAAPPDENGRLSSVGATGLSSATQQGGAGVGGSKESGTTGYGSCTNPVALATDDESSLSRTSSIKSTRRQPVDEAPPPPSPSGGPEFPDQGLGQLHFVLQYISAKSALYIRVIKGANLTAQDSNGLSDPYVKIHLLPDTGRRTKLRTRTRQRTLNPAWDEEFCYSGVLPTDLEAKTVRFTVLDEDTIGSDWMGEIAMPLKQLAHGKREYYEVFLQPKDLELEKSLTQADDRGKIQIGLYYAPAKSELTVKIMQCVNLLAMDPNGYSDPFVKLYLKPDRDKSSKFKTAVKKKTLNPAFDEEFVYYVSPQELMHKTLEITVWDQDIGTKNDFIGALMLGNKCSGSRWQHWEVLLKQPYQWHDRWHALSAELTSEQA